MWLHFERSVSYRPNLSFLISDIRAAQMSEIESGRFSLYGKV